MEEVSDPNSLCRLCLDDLTQFQEYYEIDENLSETVLTLTTIAVSKMNILVCLHFGALLILSIFQETR